MSWWDSASSGFTASGFTASGFTNLATAALKTAQKKIDKVLDIKEDELLQGGEATSSYTPQETSPVPSEDSTEKPSNDGFFDAWIPSASDSNPSSMLLSSKSPSSPVSTGLSAETLSLKDKLEKKRAARAANMAKRNAALAATKIQRSESINKEKMAQDLGQHPQSAFTAVRNERSFSEADDAQQPQHESAAESLRIESEPLRTKAESLKSEAEPLRHESEPLRTDAEPLRSGAEPLSSETEPLRPELESLRPEVDPVRQVLQEVDLTRQEADVISQEPEPDRHGIESEPNRLEPEPISIEVDPEPAKQETEPKMEEIEQEVDSENKQPVPNIQDFQPEIQEAEPERLALKPEIQDPELETEHAELLIKEPSSKETEKPDYEPAPQDEENSGGAIEFVATKEDASAVPEEECTSDNVVTDKPESPFEASAENVECTVNDTPASCDETDAPVSEADEPSCDNRDNVIPEPAEKLSCVMQDLASDAMQGSGWDDVSLSILTDSTFSSKCPSDADLVAMAPAAPAEEKLNSSWEQTVMDSSESSLEVIQVKEVEKSCEIVGQGVDDERGENQPSELTVEVEKEATESGGQEPEEGGGWENDEELNLEMDASVTSSVTGLERPLEECSSNSETIDSLSESNRTLTADDMDRSPCEEEVTEGEEEGVVQEEEEEKGEEAAEPLSSSSYVKNMLEEAMTESVKDSDSHTSSDMVRIESAQNSGHTSADEIDTTTSSDIEIISHISTPTPNGDNSRTERPFDLSPLRHALSRSLRRGSPPGHKRSDSSSSGHSYNSRCGDELLSPDSLLHREHGADHGGNPLETDKLLKDPPCPLQPIDEKTEAGDQLPSFPDAAVLQVRKLCSRNRDESKKLAEVSEVLDAREKKLFTLSQENVDLVESNNILRNQLQQVEEAREAEMEDLNALTEEFTQRIADTERSLQNVLREKESIKKKLREAEAELVKRADNAVSERVLKEKEQVISELLEEGEKLSKQQLQSNNIIKKLRTKEKDTETTVKQMRQKIEDLTSETSRLESILDTKVEHENSQNEAITKLNAAVKLQELDIHRLNSELEDSQERCRSMKVTLDNSYKEITELHKYRATHASETQKLTMSAEMQAREELKVVMEEAQTLARRQQEALINQIEDLQLSMSRMEKEQGRREDVLRQEISDLQQRLQEAEGRNQELTQNVTAATRPLLRQIENLQSTHTAQSDSYEKVERNLTERLAEAQTQLAAAIEKERNGSERVLEATMRTATLESQLSSLRQEKSRLQALLEMERTRAELLEESSSSNTAQMEGMMHSKDMEIQELKREKVLAETQLENERAKVETEKKKVGMVHEQLRDKELMLHQLQSRPSITPPGQHSREGSTVGGPDSPMSTSLQSLASSSMNVSLAEESLERSLIMATSANGASKLSLYDSLRQNNATALVENLQAQLKQREGEISQLQNDIGELEKTREAMARELVNLSTDKDELQIKVADLTNVQKNYVDLDQRYQALLQMYGEKVEEVQELRLDLQDVKEMYKAQINELLMSK